MPFITPSSAIHKKRRYKSHPTFVELLLSRADRRRSLMTHANKKEPQMKLAASFAFAFAILLIAAARAADDAKTYKPDADGYIRNWLLLDPVKLTEDISGHTEDQEKPIFAKDWVKSDHNPKSGDKLKADGKEYPWSAKESSDSIVD